MLPVGGGEQRGEVGIDVYGRTVRPSSVRHVIFKHGKNLSISEDGLSLVSMVNGHVTLEEDKYPYLLSRFWTCLTLSP